MAVRKTSSNIPQTAAPGGREVPPLDEHGSPRRVGDQIKIAGNYQHRALTSGPAVQRFWHQGKLNLLDWLFPITPGQRVLDIGCGSGVFADAIARRGADVLAIDANPDAIAYAQATFARPGLRFAQGLLDGLGLPATSFDRITCLEVVEHVHWPQIEKLLSDVRGLLRPDGAFLCTTPNYHGLWPAIEWATDRSGALARRLRARKKTGALVSLQDIAPMDGGQHVTHFNRAKLSGVLQAHGFSVRALRTTSTFAPFIAGLSWPAARRVEALEQRFDLPFGNLLAAVATVA